MKDEPNKSIEEHLGRIEQWQVDHEKYDTKRFGDIQTSVNKLPCKEDIREIVEQTITSIFAGKGTLAKNWIITTAVIITSITAIMFGIKVILGWFGIQIMKL